MVQVLQKFRVGAAEVFQKTDVLTSLFPSLFVQSIKTGKGSTQVRTVLNTYLCRNYSHFMKKTVLRQKCSQVFLKLLTR